jgi:FKBP-type peptidyl-prolyl cis-trans isomerase (trigger factor)
VLQQWETKRLKLKLLLQLGFTQEQVTSGNIKATDVLYKLAESYEKNKKLYGETIAQNLRAKQTTD